MGLCPSMSGPIPPQLTSLAELSFLLLDRNNLTGPLPASFGNSLILFGASENQLSGAIPGTLGGSNGGPLRLSRPLVKPLQREHPAHMA